MAGPPPVVGGPMVAPPPPPPATTYPVAPAAQAPAAPLQQRQWCGCGLPCEYGLSMWHVGIAGGFAFFEGDDAPEGCAYWAAEFGRTFCGCWGLGLFYAYTPAEFDRFVAVGAAGQTVDGGIFHHVGIKFTFEKSIGNSRFYVHGGLGPEFWWSQDFIVDDEGFGLFGEIGVGYVFNRNFRATLGLNGHLMFDCNTGRYFPADDDEGRDLFIWAPVLGIEVHF
jgi:hypothetical protein